MTNNRRPVIYLVRRPGGPKTKTTETDSEDGHPRKRAKETILCPTYSSASDAANNGKSN